ncbi:hypothetical protein H6F44_13495 [Pseudanabaena sp. FACHB-1277]|uniref:Uncharacterized protein n=1 Tax=Pseudanabaena cinerea FACHB-1277 TaxID=2949581 RepID=A0A926UUJ1_9CYAN|nr:hypothetical protein [Pseudanabaena cinerea]MBD2151126.1 hypothetical protein [Pseudanabaena cinerea FACHB-1277]
MADELKFEEGSQSDFPDRIADHLSKALPEAQSKAEFMCDRNFKESQRQKLKKVEEILQGRDVDALMAQDPSVVFEVVLRSGRLAIVNNHENEALDKTYEWFKKKFQEFDIRKHSKHSSLMICLVIWMNRTLRQRLQDLRLRECGDDVKRNYRTIQVKDPLTGEKVIDETTQKPKKQRVKAIIGNGMITNDDGEETSPIDQVDEDGQIHSPNRSRSAIHRSLAVKPTKTVYNDVKQVIQHDPEGKLREMVVKDNPAINAHIILKRLHIDGESLQEISKSLGAPNSSVNSILVRDAYPYLGQYVLNHLEGYEPETLRQTVEADRDGVLTKACMKDQHGERCPNAHVQYLAKQFCVCFDTPEHPVRGFEAVTRELVEKYGYNITKEMVEEFWRTTGVMTLTKAVRLFNVKKRNS